MKEIITDLSILETPSEQLKFASEEGIDETEGKEIIAELQAVFDEKKEIYALAAPMIGINKRIFGIRFDDAIKYFINPIITKKSGLIVAPETFASMPGKEILIGRPEEITVVYHTEAFKYEDNKFIGPAARIFDQMVQVFDGVLPNELGLVSDVEADGSLGDLTEEEINEAAQIWKQFVQKKLSSMESEINEDENVKKLYTALRFDESVINGRTKVIEDQETIRQVNAQNRAMSKAICKANTRNFVRGKK